MNHSTHWNTVAALAVGALLIRCSDQTEPEPAATPEPEADEIAESPETFTDDEEVVAPTGEDEPTEEGESAEEEFDRIQRTPTPDEALILHDAPTPGAVPAPSPHGEPWPLNGSFDLTVMGDYMDATRTMSTVSVDCAARWDEVRYVWVRESEDGDHGFTCFEEPGADMGAYRRQIDYICQAPQTTAQAMVFVGNEYEMWGVFTPEHTTADEWECFDFGGERVEAVQADVEAAN